MKVALVGKGGSGKTTVAALLARHLVRSGASVLAIDADINQHLAGALGMSEDEAAAVPAMGAQLALIKDYLRGTNPLIRSSASMVKTTPPGSGSRLVRVDGDEKTLTSYQFDLLAALADNAGRVLNRDRLMDLVKGEELEALDRSIDVHISRIRLAIEDDPKRPRRILTVRGSGYVFARTQDQDGEP